MRKFLVILFIKAFLPIDASSLLKFPLEDLSGERRNVTIFNNQLNIYDKQLSAEFSKEALLEAAAGKIPNLDCRTDLRYLPLITIDGENAHDFDDAVFAEPSSETSGGWHIVVAIADVSYYVSLNSAIDYEAQCRGNSMYFPGQVLPMLPEKLSNELCSLKPHEDRACLAVHVWIDARGCKLRHQFVRGLMKSHARLTYAQVQQGLDSPERWDVSILPYSVIHNLEKAYKSLKRAQKKRGTLDVQIDEPELIVNEQGNLFGIDLRPRLKSYHIVEAFMILANTAAAETLENSKILTVYRSHEPPNLLKIQQLRPIFSQLKVPFPKESITSPKTLISVNYARKGTSMQRLIDRLVLRTQCRAFYSPDNYGHFGLNLSHYTHFTSPIRRYADLMVHRGLIAAVNQENAALTRYQIERISGHINLRERLSNQEESLIRTKYIIHHLRNHVGQSFRGIVDWVVSSGIFIELDAWPVCGFAPRRLLLQNDYYHFISPTRQLLGQNHKDIWQIGDLVEGMIIEADAQLKRLTLKVTKRV